MSLNCYANKKFVYEDTEQKYDIIIIADNMK